MVIIWNGDHGAEVEAWTGDIENSTNIIYPDLQYMWVAPHPPWMAGGYEAVDYVLPF